MFLDPTPALTIVGAIAVGVILWFAYRHFLRAG